MKPLLYLGILAALIWLGYRAYTYQPPPARHLAPVGTFFLTRYVSAQTPTGVFAMTPGEEVRLVPGPQPAATRLVTDGSHEFEVDPTYLTDDMDIASQLRQSDGARQKSAASAALSEKIAAEQAERRHRIELSKKAEDDLARSRAAALPTPR